MWCWCHRWWMMVSKITWPFPLSYLKSLSLSPPTPSITVAPDLTISTVLIFQLFDFPCPLILCQTSLNGTDKRVQYSGERFGCCDWSSLCSLAVWNPQEGCLLHLMWKGHSQDRPSNASWILWQTLNLQQSAESLMFQTFEAGESLCPSWGICN